LDELKVDKSKVFVILTKCDGEVGLSERIEKIANDLSLLKPLSISSKTGYGIHNLKTMVAHNLYSQLLSRGGYQANVKKVPDEGAYTIAPPVVHT
jgi:50S ribosomal subunit-associated GTPase HflX